MNATAPAPNKPILTPTQQDRLDYENHRTELLREIDPIGALEFDLFDQLIAASWRLHRLRRLEDEIFQNEPNPLSAGAASQALDRLARYQTAAERSYHRALQALRQIQTNYAVRDLAGQPPLHAMSGLVNSNQVRKLFPKPVEPLFPFDASAFTQFPAATCLVPELSKEVG